MRYEVWRSAAAGRLRKVRTGKGTPLRKAQVEVTSGKA